MINLYRRSKAPDRHPCSSCNEALKMNCRISHEMFGVCPCNKCLVWTTCNDFCYRRYAAGKKYFNIEPMSEEDFYKTRNIPGYFRKISKFQR